MTARAAVTLTGACARAFLASPIDRAGGSVTRGHGAGGIPSAYGIAFETLLNEAFPHCAPAEDARMRRHEVVVRASGGTASNFALQQFDANLHGIEAQVDMVLVEFAPNDSFMEVDARARSLTPTGGGDARRAEEAEEHDAPTGGRGSDDVSGEKTVQFYTEALVRRILSMRTGNGTLPAAAVWLESSWMSEGLRGVLLQRNNADRGDAARTDGIDPKTMAIMTRWGSWDPMVLMASLAHHAVLNWCARASARASSRRARARARPCAPTRATDPRLTRAPRYQVPTVSLVDVLAPLTFNSFGPWNEGGYDESSAFAWANIAADQCCHPNAAGHIIMALMLARELDHEAHVYGVPRLPEEEDRSARVLSHSSAESGSASSVAGSGQDAAALLPPQARAHLRPLLWLSPGDEKRYLAPPYFSLDFMDSRLAGTGASVIAPGALGWSVEEDVPGKQGLLAREPGSHAAIVLPVAAVRRAHPEEDRMILSIGYLSSYSGFSSISYWVDQTPALAAERADALEPRRCRSDFNMSLERQVIVASRRSNRGQVSVFETVATEPIAMAAGARDMYLHVCLHPIHIRGALFARKGKFKLLTVVGVHAEGGA